MSQPHPSLRRSARLRSRTHASEESVTRRSTQNEDGAHMNHLQSGEGGARTACRRRSPRLHPQIHPTEGTLLRPHIDATEDGAGVGVASHRRSSKRLHSQIQAREGGDRVFCRRRGTRRNPQPHTSLASDGMSLLRGTSRASPLDVEDLLREILLRLPLDLHSLSRASAVCKPWRGIVVDPKFLRPFYTCHRKPPLLGFFKKIDQQVMFTPVMPPAPDRILPRSFEIERYSDVLDSRHGHVLLTDWTGIIVYDPITSKQRRMSIPPEFMKYSFSGVVLCAASDQGHVHGGCHSYPFKVVLVTKSISIYREEQPIVCVYSSETATWGGLISTEAPHDLTFPHQPGTLVGGSLLYWLLDTKAKNILEFDLDTQNLTMIAGPMNMTNNTYLKAEDGAVGLAAISFREIQIWQRKIDCQGIPIWLLRKTDSWHELLKITKRRTCLFVLGYDGDTDVFFLYIGDGNIYMLHARSMQVRKVNGIGLEKCYPFTSFHSLGRAVPGGTNGAEMLG